MSRKKRKNAISPIARENNGRAKRPSRKEMERMAKEAREREERRIIGPVLNQPHRRGNRDQRCENALGRFTMKLAENSRIAYDAGEEYRNLHRRWRVLKGFPVEGVASLGIGAEPTQEMIDQARHRWLDAQRALANKAGEKAYFAVQSLVMQDIDCPMGSERLCAIGLHVLAVHFGMLGKAQRAA